MQDMSSIKPLIVTPEQWVQMNTTCGFYHGGTILDLYDIHHQPSDSRVEVNITRVDIRELNRRDLCKTGDELVHQIISNLLVMSPTFKISEQEDVGGEAYCICTRQPVTDELAPPIEFLPFTLGEREELTQLLSDHYTRGTWLWSALLSQHDRFTSEMRFEFTDEKDGDGLIKRWYTSYRFADLEINQWQDGSTDIELGGIIPDIYREIHTPITGLFNIWLSELYSAGLIDSLIPEEHTDSLTPLPSFVGYVHYLENPDA